MTTYNTPLPDHREPGGEGVVADDVNLLTDAIKELRTKKPTGPRGEKGEPGDKGDQGDPGVGEPGPPGADGALVQLSTVTSVDDIPAGSPVGSWWAVVS